MVFFIASAVFAVVIVGYMFVHKLREKQQVAVELKSVPTFNFTKVTGQNFSNKQLIPTSNTVFIYFNSTCASCQYEAQGILENISSFKDTQFLFVSTEPIDIIKEFSCEYNLQNINQIIFLHDSLNIFSNRFDATSIPYLLIYNKKGKLLKKHKGQLNVSEILNVLNERNYLPNHL
jgi:peroxiredoxin